MSHALVWWNAHLRSRGTSRLTWEAFKGLLKEQFYPVGYEEARRRTWRYLQQGVQDYTTEFWRQALALGVPLEELEILEKYLGGLHEELRAEVSMVPLKSIGEACKRAIDPRSRRWTGAGGEGPRECQG